MLSIRDRKLLTALERRKAREREGAFRAEGVRVVEDLLASDLTVRWVVSSPGLKASKRGERLVAQVEERGIRNHQISETELESLADTVTPQGIIAVGEIPQRDLARLAAILAGDAVILVLDAVQDPGNFGTLVRTADAVGASAVIALPGTVDSWNSKSVRAAAGSLFRLPIVRTTWPELLPWLRQEDFRVLASSAEGDPISQVGDIRRVALVVGNEGAGISDEIFANADRGVGVPLRGHAESLNVTAAAAILLYELLR
ncbi:MAG TPA: RNA methyltransferase [Longimicrobiaceae bacterium]|nr:RNA methyltransferase [Longimicrobiaceae bacterium]